MILGVHPNASGEAVLVRLGWMPLDYLLALHGLRWYLRIFHGQYGEEFRERLLECRGGDCRDRHLAFLTSAHEFLVLMLFESVIGT